MDQEKQTDNYFMAEAFKWAQHAGSIGEVPVGAVVTYKNEIISHGFNQREHKQNAILHAEVTAISEACKSLSQWRLLDCVLYVTLEPCLMCTGAIINSRIKQVVFAAGDPKAGALGGALDITSYSCFNHSFEVKKGLMGADSSALLKNFFKVRRLRDKKS